FDSLPYTQNQFLREGEKSGEVVVSFVDALDEREYQVVRTVGSSSIYIFDPETQSKLVTGKTDVVAWLKEHLGVDPSADLTALFEDSIGVPQGLLTAAFMERPASRKNKFDPLLQVDEYEETWLRLRDVLRILNEELVSQREKIALLTGELNQLPDIEQERSALESELESKQVEQQKLESEVMELEQERAALDAKLEELQDTERHLESLSSRVQVLNVQQEQAQSALSKSEQAYEQVQASSAGFHLYLEAEKELEQLDRQRSDRDQLQKERLELEKQIALSTQRLDDIETSLNEIKTIEVKLEQLEPLVSRQEELSDEAVKVQKQINELEKQLSVVSNEENRLALLETQLEEMKAAVAQAQSLHTQKEPASKNLKTLELELARLQNDQGTTQAEIKKTRQLRLTLDESTDAECPICHQALDTTHRELLLREYEQQIEELINRSAILEHELESKQQSLQEQEEHIDQLNSELAELPDERQLDLLHAEHETLLTALEEQRKQVQALPQLKKKFSEIERALADLDDPKTSWTLLNAKLEAHPQLLQDREDQQKTLHAFKVELSQTDQELEAFETLDERLETYKLQRKQNQDAHNTYLANITLAEQVEDRQSQLNKLGEELQAAEQNLKDEKKTLQSLRRDFDKARHAHVQTELVNRSKELARLETILDEAQKRHEKLAHTIIELQKRQELLRESKSDLERNERTVEALEFIRTTIRNAGPFVTRALVQTISLEANRIFGEIMNDHTLRLLWNEDYGITIEQAGEEREFSQLSGGEKTAAALSVRLALLRELSQIRVAFFDEPTSNLDDQRRENLASQITQITGFNQLFVISHDDTFERETHHVIHVEKSHGASQVEIG
ncbi:MAG: hypothetical protein PVH60_01780, partial [Anaerolineales bacterium]